MRIQVLTIFPELFRPFLETALLGRAVERGLLGVEVHDLREFTLDRHRSVDDEPFGGGGGMVMTAPPWLAGGARSSRRAAALACPALPPGPQARRRQGPRARRTGGPGAPVRPLRGDRRARAPDGRGRGDLGRRLRRLRGELPAMLLIEAVSRQVPGVVQRTDSVERDSFRAGLLDLPHYTRPAGGRRDDGSRGPAVGRPCRDRAVAGARSAAPDARKAAGSAGDGGASPRLRAASSSGFGPPRHPPGCPEAGKLG